MSDQIETGPDGAIVVGGNTMAAKMMQGREYLPRVQFCIANSKLCKRGKVPINNFAFIKGRDEPVALGEDIDALIVGYRAKAMVIKDGSVEVNLSPNEDAEGNATGRFAEIQQAASNKQKGFLYGLEYLLWLPDIQEFATFFMGTPSLRQESPNIYKRLGKGATLFPEECNDGENEWFTAVSRDCDVIEPMPTAEQKSKAAALFVDVKSQETKGKKAAETVADDDDDR